MTHVFALIGIIHNYNTTVTTLIETDYIERTGSEIYEVLRGLEHTLDDGIGFYMFAALISFLFCAFMFQMNKTKMAISEEKLCFYNDYIAIIDDLLEETK